MPKVGGWSSLLSLLHPPTFGCDCGWPNQHTGRRSGLAMLGNSSETSRESLAEVSQRIDYQPTPTQCIIPSRSLQHAPFAATC